MKPLLISLALFLLIVMGTVGGSWTWWQHRVEARRAAAEKAYAVEESELTARLDERKRTIAEQRNWPYPPPDTGRSAAEAVESLAPRLAQLVNNKHPKSARENIIRTAEERYGMYRKGDHVSFVLRGGVGAKTQVSGVVYDIGEERVHVGSRWFLLEDLPKPVRERFQPDEAQVNIRRYVETRLARFESARKTYARGVRRQLMAREGYVPAEGSEGAEAAGATQPDWVPLAEQLDRLAREWLDEKLDQARTDAFEEQGFVRHRDRWVLPNPWVRLQKAL